MPVADLLETQSLGAPEPRVAGPIGQWRKANIRRSPGAGSSLTPGHFEDGRWHLPRRHAPTPRRAEVHRRAAGGIDGSG